MLPSITVGAEVFDRERGDRVVAHNAGRQFRAASVVKLLIAIDALQQSYTGAERVRRMLVYSDNQIASALWVEGGGDALVRRMSERIGLSDTEPPATPGIWGNTLLSARDVVATYRFILNELPESPRNVIVGALADTTRIAGDGWYQHFGIPSGIGKPWAIKQGWSNSSDDIVVHTTGLAGQDFRYIVVLLLEDGLSTSWATLRKAATAAANETAPLVNNTS